MQFQPIRTTLVLACCIAWLTVAAQAQQEDPTPPEQPATEQPAATPDTPATATPEKPDESHLRIFEREPYDEVRFEDGTSVKIVQLPSDMEPRQPPERPRFPGRKLEVVLLERPEEKFEALWKDITEIRLWEQLILDDAEALVSAKKFDEAYYYFDFLLTHHPAWPGLAAATERYLFEDASTWRKKKRYDYELALLIEVYDRNPSRPGLADALATVSDRLMTPEHKRQEYPAVRRLLKNLERMYPQHPTVAEWRKRLSDEAAELAAQARAEREAGRLREAYLLATRAVRVWPYLDEGRQLMIDIQKEYPRVIVGVALPAGSALTRRPDDWSSRRCRRLLERSLQEFIGHGPQGGQYVSPYGELTKLDLDLTLSFQVTPGLRWPGEQGVVTGYDVARLVLALADPSRADYRPEWAGLFRRVTVHDVFEAEIELYRPHVRPEALLQQALLQGPYPTAGAAGVPSTSGPYVQQPAASGETVFLANADYFARRPAQPRELVERHFPDGRDALHALRQGEVGVVDRVNPWELKRLRADQELVVEQYAVPTVHCLVPNLDNPFLASRLFRRALLYALPRGRLLREQILKGEELEQTQVISGPFPIGRDTDDPLGYAYNDQVEPRAYEPRLAIALAQLALNVVNRKLEGQAGAEPMKKVPPLVLAHPAEDVARVACRAIKQYLDQLQIPITLIELPVDPAAPAPPYDLLYAELAVREPATDARWLLGSGGLVGRASPYMDLALRQLEEADGWKDARDKLLEIHRLAYEDVSLIPLWQMTDYFAYRKDLKGVGTRPVTLYQRIEQWELTPWFPEASL